MNEAQPQPIEPGVPYQWTFAADDDRRKPGFQPEPGRLIIVETAAGQFDSHEWKQSRFPGYETVVLVEDDAAAYLALAGSSGFWTLEPEDRIVLADGAVVSGDLAAAFQDAAVNSGRWRDLRDIAGPELGWFVIREDVLAELEPAPAPVDEPVGDEARPFEILKVQPEILIDEDHRLIVRGHTILYFGDGIGLDEFITGVDIKDCVIEGSPEKRKRWFVESTRPLVWADELAGGAKGPDLRPGPVDEERLRATTDAHVWAEEFAKVRPDVDQGLMIGWFANAMAAAEAGPGPALDDVDPVLTASLSGLVDSFGYAGVTRVLESLSDRALDAEHRDASALTRDDLIAAFNDGDPAEPETVQRWEATNEATGDVVASWSVTSTPAGPSSFAADGLTARQAGLLRNLCQAFQSGAGELPLGAGEFVATAEQVRVNGWEWCVPWLRETLEGRGEDPWRSRPPEGMEGMLVYARVPSPAPTPEPEPEPEFRIPESWEIGAAYDAGVLRVNFGGEWDSAQALDRDDVLTEKMDLLVPVGWSPRTERVDPVTAVRQSRTVVDGGRAWSTDRVNVTDAGETLELFNPSDPADIIWVFCPAPGPDLALGARSVEVLALNQTPVVWP